jgi:NPCBM/NEW2 domain-containing protein
MRSPRSSFYYLLSLFFGIGLAWPTMGAAEEIWLHDNARIYGLIRSVASDGKLGVLLPTGDVQTLPLEEIVAIRFLGRNPLLIQSGTQEFRFVNGGSLRGQILQTTGDAVRVQTTFAGIVELSLSHLKGFVAVPLAGFSGRKADELVEGDRGKLSPNLDVVLDERGSTYAGVVRKLDRSSLYLDHEDLLQVVPLKIGYVAGARLADAARDPVAPWKGDVQVRLRTRDGSVVQGALERIHLGQWTLRPSWDPRSVLRVDLDEIALVQIMGGRAQYLSQLTPVKADEKTVLSPPQPYRMDSSCQGDDLSIAGRRYPWGIGVHADSEITFDLKGRFREFRSDVGIATRMGPRGSVVFSVLGDGKELQKSEVVRGSDARPLEVSVSVAGVQRLTLKVTHGGDLDLGDVANWGSARVLR